MARRLLTLWLTSGSSSLEVYVLDPSIEEVGARRNRSHSVGMVFSRSLPPRRDMSKAMGVALVEAPPAFGMVPVLLTLPDVRRFGRKLIEGAHPDMVVTSYDESKASFSGREARSSRRGRLSPCRLLLYGVLDSRLLPSCAADVRIYVLTC
jgi:type III secretory pathway component EscV